MNRANRLVEAGCCGKEELCEFTIAELPRDRIFSWPTDERSRLVMIG